MQSEDVYQVVTRRQDVMDHVAVDQYVSDRIQRAVDEVFEPKGADETLESGSQVEGEVYPTEEKAFTTDDGKLLICLEIHGREFHVLVSPERWEWREESVANVNGGELDATQLKLFREPSCSHRSH
jgi:hypothetical protein